MTRLSRIYQEGPISVGDTVVLSAGASHHVTTVLRSTLSQELMVFNGDGFEYRAKVTCLQKKSVHLQVLEKISAERESPLKIELAQAISRGERMDYAIQKAVELGVSEMTPLFTERCGVSLDADREARRLAHWHSIIVSACEQSGRLKLPTLHRPQSLSSWLLLPRRGLSLVCLPSSDAGVLPSGTPEKVTLLIGPEGGLSDVEVQQARASGCQALLLGPRILRTETAAVVSISVVQARWGDLR